MPWPKLKAMSSYPASTLGLFTQPNSFAGSEKAMDMSSLEGFYFYFHLYYLEWKLAKTGLISVETGRFSKS